MHNQIITKRKVVSLEHMKNTNIELFQKEWLSDLLSFQEIESKINWISQLLENGLSVEGPYAVEDRLVGLEDYF